MSKFATSLIMVGGVRRSVFQSLVLFRPPSALFIFANNKIKKKKKRHSNLMASPTDGSLLIIPWGFVSPSILCERYRWWNWTRSFYFMIIIIIIIFGKKRKFIKRSCSFMGFVFIKFGRLLLLSLLRWARRAVTAEL